MEVRCLRWIPRVIAEQGLSVSDGNLTARNRRTLVRCQACVVGRVECTRDQAPIRSRIAATTASLDVALTSIRIPSPR